VLPYTGSFAGFAASLAAACQLPIVCTRKAGLPDHLGETAVWVDENSPEPLAERIIELLSNEPRRRQLGNQLLKRAETFLQWDVIADQTLKIYEDTIHKKTGQPLDESDAVTARAV
jgi:glycosyltransferase involved in cell wall biosynthesis